MVKSIDWIQFLAPQLSSGTPVLGDPTPSFGLHEHQVHKWCTNILEEKRKEGKKKQASKQASLMPKQYFVEK